MKFYSNGKLLITGEYFVLNGALSLALPTVYGQYLEINENDLILSIGQAIIMNKRFGLIVK